MPQTFAATKSNSPLKTHPLRQQSYPKGISEMKQGVGTMMAVHGNINRQMVPQGMSPGHSPMMQVIKFIK